MTAQCRLCLKETDAPTVQLGDQGHAAILCSGCQLRQLIPTLNIQELFAALGGINGLRHYLGNAWLAPDMPDSRWHKLWVASLDRGAEQPLAVAVHDWLVQAVCSIEAGSPLIVGEETRHLRLTEVIDELTTDLIFDDGTTLRLSVT